MYRCNITSSSCSEMMLGKTFFHFIIFFPLLSKERCSYKSCVTQKGIQLRLFLSPVLPWPTWREVSGTSRGVLEPQWCLWGDEEKALGLGQPRQQSLLGFCREAFCCLVPSWLVTVTVSSPQLYPCLSFCVAHNLVPFFLT